MLKRMAWLLLGGLIAVLSSHLIIATHESGHAIMAKTVGREVDQFSVGTGQLVWADSLSSTALTWHIWPSSGFVRSSPLSEIEDEVNVDAAWDSELLPQTRLDFLRGWLVSAAGSLLALLVLAAVLTAIWPKTGNTEQTGSVSWNSWRMISLGAGLVSLLALGGLSSIMLAVISVSPLLLLKWGRSYESRLTLRRMLRSTLSTTIALSSTPKGPLVLVLLSGLAVNFVNLLPFGAGTDGMSTTICFFAILGVPIEVFANVPLMIATNILWIGATVIAFFTVYDRCLRDSRKDRLGDAVADSSNL